MVVDGAVYPGIDGSIITRVHWEWGDGDSEDDWFPASHTYETYGEYTIKITAYQSDGLTSTKTFIFYAPVDTTSVTFPDANLETVIREAIDKLEGPISVSDLESLVMLEAPGKGISDLTGLEYCLNLQYLGLWDSNISDISPLAGLLNLQGLELDGNNISDISPLAGLINLEYLNLLSNNISDISSLISLTNLRELWLAENSISDISALAGLFNLHTLDLADNNISDISPLVENSNLSVDDIVYLMGNPLSPTSIGIYIPQLEARGVYVAY
jgi:Leucine-rich repeat (LRR) protein